MSQQDQIAAKAWKEIQETEFLREGEGIAIIKSAIEEAYEQGWNESAENARQVMRATASET